MTPRSTSAPRCYRPGITLAELVEPERPRNLITQTRIRRDRIAGDYRVDTERPDNIGSVCYIPAVCIYGRRRPCKRFSHVVGIADGPRTDVLSPTRVIESRCSRYP